MLGNKYICENNGVVYEFDKDLSDSEKYIVCACAKNEDDYIVEWVEHYLNYGFDKIIIADNNDNPNILSEILNYYIGNGTVQLLDCHGMTNFQLDIYDMILQERNFKWCAFLDCDEFLELTIHGNIKDFLGGINEDAVLLHWMMFGSNGLVYKSGEPIQERFKEPMRPILYFKENMFIKSIVRKDHNFARFYNSHSPLSNGKAKYSIGGVCAVNYASHVYSLPEYRYGYIKHYYTKSFEEWISNKTRRGWPDCMPKELMGIEKYFILDKTPSMPIDKFTKSVFDDNDFFMNLYNDNKDIFSKYKAIEVKSTTQNFYALTEYIMSCMQQMKDHLFMITNENISKEHFIIFLEYAIETGNYVCLCKDKAEISFVMNKYNCGNYYFIRDCL